ncbi:hypothetical protein MS3_00000585 [Schistosoma haematobium]|uniref:Uncharacterized protein n=1 Tax=Schistosoma haematobium TaxID=6185 RepID=A0A922LEZ3_SCHHA|nr:hypothetical protein MS3_00000585 [Schistosoma haematobium]KAH9581273.1 hypothetical protein MS3_00000585 [Schistosoma haematobium]
MDRYFHLNEKRGNNVRKCKSCHYSLNDWFEIFFNYLIINTLISLTDSVAYTLYQSICINIKWQKPCIKYLICKSSINYLKFHRSFIAITITLFTFSFSSIPSSKPSVAKLSTSQWYYVPLMFAAYNL